MLCERGFAGTIVPQDRDEFSRPDMQVHMIHRPLLRLYISFFVQPLIIERQFFCPYHRLFSSYPRRMSSV